MVSPVSGSGLPPAVEKAVKKEMINNLFNQMQQFQGMLPVAMTGQQLVDQEMNKAKQSPPGADITAGAGDVTNGPSDG